MEILYNNKKAEFSEKEYFIASQEPLYYGLIINPSSDLWSYMVEFDQVECKINNKTEKYSIPYRIDVGENSIFFIMP
jgi:hypothetical protein